MRKKRTKGDSDYMVIEVKREIGERVQEIAERTDNKKRKIATEALEAGLAVKNFG